VPLLSTPHHFLIRAFWFSYLNVSRTFKRLPSLRVSAELFFLVFCFTVLLLSHFWPAPTFSRRFLERRLFMWPRPEHVWHGKNILLFSIFFGLFPSVSRLFLSNHTFFRRLLCLILMLKTSSFTWTLLLIFRRWFLRCVGRVRIFHALEIAPPSPLLMAPEMFPSATKRASPIAACLVPCNFS